MTVELPIATSTDGIGFIIGPTEGPLIPIGTSGPSSGSIAGAVIGCLLAAVCIKRTSTAGHPELIDVLCQAILILLFLWYRSKSKPKPESKKKFTNKWDEANALDRQDMSFVSVRAAPEVPGATINMGPGNYAYRESPKE
jgi:hypothetical protein